MPAIFPCENGQISTEGVGGCGICRHGCASCTVRNLIWVRDQAQKNKKQGARAEFFFSRDIGTDPTVQHCHENRTEFREKEGPRKFSKTTHFLNGK